MTAEKQPAVLIIHVSTCIYWPSKIVKLPLLFGELNYESLQGCVYFVMVIAFSMNIK